MENLLKRHRDLEAKLDAQEGRLLAFSKNADELIKNRHSEGAYVDRVSQEAILCSKVSAESGRFRCSRSGLTRP